MLLIGLVWLILLPHGIGFNWKVYEKCTFLGNTDRIRWHTTRSVVEQNAIKNTLVEDWGREMLYIVDHWIKWWSDWKERTLRLTDIREISEVSGTSTIWFRFVTDTLLSYQCIAMQLGFNISSQKFSIFKWLQEKLRKPTRTSKIKSKTCLWAEKTILHTHLRHFRDFKPDMINTGCGLTLTRLLKLL